VPLGRSVSENVPSCEVEVVRVEPSELIRTIVALGIKESSGPVTTPETAPLRLSCALRGARNTQKKQMASQKRSAFEESMKVGSPGK